MFVKNSQSFQTFPPETSGKPSQPLSCYTIFIQSDSENKQINYVLLIPIVVYAKGIKFIVWCSHASHYKRKLTSLLFKFVGDIRWIRTIV